jgi:hypothetical protein
MRPIPISEVAMKHATVESLAGFEGLLEQLRAIPGLTEKGPGVFYRKSKAFLHFHEDPQGLFADYRPGDDWLRLEVSGAAGQAALVAALRLALT